jgi:hypothetical protein
MSKLATLLLITILALSSSIVVETVFAQQSLSRRSVPDFTVAFEAQNETIIITIKNQPYASSINGITYHLYYNIRHKEHSEDTWSELSWSDRGSGTLVPQSDSQYTVVSYSSRSYSVDDQLDFQVQALLGGFVLHQSQNPWLPDVSYFGVPAASESYWSNTQTITIESQTPSPQPTPTPTSSPYSEPQSTEQKLILGVAAFVVVFAFGLVLVYRIKRK